MSARHACFTRNNIILPRCFVSVATLLADTLPETYRSPLNQCLEDETYFWHVCLFSEANWLVSGSVSFPDNIWMHGIIVYVLRFSLGLLADTWKLFMLFSCISASKYHYRLITLMAVQVGSSNLNRLWNPGGDDCILGRGWPHPNFQNYNLPGTPKDH